MATNVTGTKITELSQKASVNSTDKIMVIDGTEAKLVEVSLLKGADNLTGEYVELNGLDGNLYRVYVDSEGKAKAIKVKHLQLIHQVLITILKGNIKL